MNISKFLRTAFFKEHLQWLLFVDCLSQLGTISHEIAQISFITKWISLPYVWGYKIPMHHLKQYIYKNKDTERKCGLHNKSICAGEDIPHVTRIKDRKDCNIHYFITSHQYFCTLFLFEPRFSFWSRGSMYNFLKSRSRTFPIYSWSPKSLCFW